jgi:Lon-like ATP-dependent protease
MSLTNLTLADFTVAVSSGEVWELQDVLESLVVDDRLRRALFVLKSSSMLGSE